MKNLLLALVALLVGAVVQAQNPTPEQVNVRVAELLNTADYVTLAKELPAVREMVVKPLLALADALVAHSEGRFEDSNKAIEELAHYPEELGQGTVFGMYNYALINNLMDEAFKPYREYVYEYHRLGLDEMINNVANARARIAEGLSVLKDANRARPATYVVTTFLDAKNDELVNIFAGGTSDEKKRVYELLVDLDPTRQAVYDEINRER